MPILIVLLAVILSMALGFIWYSPLLFGPLWMRLVGITEKKKRKGAMVFGLLSSAAFAFLLALSMLVSQGSLRETALSMAYVWLLFGFLLRLPHFFFEQRSFKLFWIYATHDLANMLLIGCTVAWFRS